MNFTNYKEEKIKDGIYLSMSQNKTIQKPQEGPNCSTPIRKGYVYNSQSELISLYVFEFSECAERIKKLYKSNEEMFEFDPHDYDLIEARQENLEIINRTIKKMKQIQEELRELCSYHPITTVDVFDLFKEQQKEQNTDIGNNKQDEIITELEL